MKTAYFEPYYMGAQGKGYQFTLTTQPDNPYWLSTPEVLDEIRVLRGMGYIVTGNPKTGELIKSLTLN